MDSSFFSLSEDKEIHVLTNRIEENRDVARLALVLRWAVV